MLIHIPIQLAFSVKEMWKVVSLSDTLRHDPLSERKQRVETTRAKPNLVPRRTKEEPRHTPRRGVQ